MKLHPFTKCVEQAKTFVDAGHTIHQQFNCEHCGVKQTIEEKNRFFTTGHCEECGKITDIRKHGCNYMLIMGDYK